MAKKKTDDSAAAPASVSTSKSKKNIDEPPTKSKKAPVSSSAPVAKPKKVKEAAPPPVEYDVDPDSNPNRVKAKVNPKLAAREAAATKGKKSKKKEEVIPEDEYGDEYEEEEEDSKSKKSAAKKKPKKDLTNSIIQVKEVEILSKAAKRKMKKENKPKVEDEPEQDQDEEEEEEDYSSRKKSTKKTKKKQEEEEEYVEEEYDEDYTPKKSKKGKKVEEKPKKGKKSKNQKDEEDDEEDIIDWPSFVRLKESKLKKKYIRDVKADDFTLGVPGQILITSASLTLVEGQRYGIVGRNGIGKSVLMRTIAHRIEPFDKIPDYIRILYVEQEISGDDLTPLESVLSADVERIWLLEQEKILTQEEKEAEDRLAEKEKMRAEKIEQGIEFDEDDFDDDEDEYKSKRSYDLRDIYDRLREIESAKAEAKAATVLAGLGFPINEIRVKKTKEYSGGWRMRIALARALFVQPDLLILDEPTNHLDLNAVIWLEDYLSNWKKTLLVVSHERNFLSNVATNIIHFHNQTMTTYKGDYDTFVKVRAMNQRAQGRKKDSQAKHEEKIKDFINKNKGKGGQVKSRQKMMNKFQPVILDTDDPSLCFGFPDPEPLGIPVLQLREVSFKYSDQRPIFNELDFGVDMESRVAVVGPNGVGKSTLLKLMAGLLKETDGYVYRNRNLRIARFSQHHVDQLIMDQTPLEYMQSKFGDASPLEIRKHLGRFGLSGNLPLRSIQNLSGGQKSRVVLAEICWQNPHIMLLDEPTNHLDMEMIESLGEALLDFKGGIVLVSHNQRLVELITNELWVCGRDGSVTIFDGEFEDYKQEVIREIEETMNNFK